MHRYNGLQRSAGNQKQRNSERSKRHTRRQFLLQQLENRQLLAAAPFSENFDGFTGAGIVSSPVPGQLNSNDWRVVGASDGDTSFGGDFSSGDHARGASTGGVTTGGVYAFDVGSGNTALGIQPGGSDYTPGNLTLKIDNTSDATQSNWSVDFTIWSYNDTDRANNVLFQYSTDDVNYTPVAAADFITGEAASGTPAWESVGRSLMLPVSVPAGTSLYLQWTTDDVSGGGSRDEIAVDDIAVAPEATVDNFTLQILHASDLEGGVEAIERAANFATLVDHFEGQTADFDGSVLLSAGDNYIGGPFFSGAGDFAVRDELQAAYQTLFGEQGLNNIREGGGRIDISIMNILGFDASAIGNHEFDFGSDTFEGLIEEDIRGGTLGDVRWLGAQFPYLSANLDFSGDADLGNLFTSDILPNTAFQADLGDLAATGALRKIAPATLVQTGGETIGVVGATTQLLESISSPSGTLGTAGTVNDMPALAAVLQPVIDDILDGDDDVAGNSDDVNKVVLVSHLQQLALEEALIGLLSGVDVVIAGGSDTLLADGDDVLRPGDTAEGSYPVMTSNLDTDPALIVSTDGEYSYLGRLVIDFDANGLVIPRSVQEPISGAYATTDANTLAVVGGATIEDAVAASTKGTEVKKLTDAVSGVVVAKDSNIVGRTGVYLEGNRSEIRTQETNIGNLTSDANLAYAQSIDATVLVSIKNGGGIRAPIGEVDSITGELLPPQGNAAAGKAVGDISQLDIENTLRFNNGLTLLDLTLAELVQVVEHGVAASGPGNTPGQFPQIGGMRFSYDTSLPSGSRVQSLALTDELGNVSKVVMEDGGMLADPNEVIRIVTLNFLADGGDSYPFDVFGENRVDLVDPAGPAGAATFATPGSEQDALAEYLLANHATVPYYTNDTPVQQDRRIVDLASNGMIDTVTTDVASGELELVDLGQISLAGAEIVVYDDARALAFVTFAGGVQVIDMSNPAAPALVGPIAPSASTGATDEVTSVAVHGDLLAMAVPDADKTLPGHVFLYDLSAYTNAISQIVFVNAVQVGALPDMITFTPDGSQIVVANEGEPTDEGRLASMMTGLAGFEVQPIFTVADVISGTTGALNATTAGDYQPVGILDGLGAYELDANTIRVFANHELTSNVGAEFNLANNATLTGARISYFDIDKATRQIVDSGLAFDTIVNAAGVAVDDANKGGIGDGGGLARLCSGILVEAGSYNFVDTIYFAGEEDSNANGGLGGLEYALDAANGTLYALPALGYAAWENVTPIDTGDAGKTALLIGDDREATPLYLWVGDKDVSVGAGFLERNGLTNGTLYAWKADDGSQDPSDWAGTGSSRAGTWVAMTNTTSIAAQDAEIDANGAFEFSRPEDVATDPSDGSRAVLASTGRTGFAGDADLWGTTYLVDITFAAGVPTVATLDIIYDGDDAGSGQFAGPDFGLRSPDNLDWADDGLIYIQEDRSVGAFGDESGEEASIWRIDPNNGLLERVGQIDRTAVLPSDATDGDPTDLGDWESSGIIDVSGLFGEAAGSLFLFDVQAHSVRDGAIGGNAGLVQGGQLSFLTNAFATSTQPTSDPVGSVSIIDVSAGAASATANQVGFSQFNGTEAELRDMGVRIFPGKSASQDFEPEYITVAPDGSTAYVTLQEANAVAVLNLSTQTFSDILPLGLKDHTLPFNMLDPSNRDSGIELQNAPVFGMYMPDAIASFAVGGQTYFVTANEGDGRDIDETRIGDYSVSELDPSATLLGTTVQADVQDDAVLGRLKSSNVDGDLDGDGDIDKLHVYGGRSMSIFDSTGNLVFDSGDLIGRVTAAMTPTLFNANDGDPGEFDDRSDDKGAEPEGVTLATIGSQTYAFLGLERAGGGVMIFNITDPINAQFVGYTRVDGDVAPEGLTFVPSGPGGTPLLLVTNEESNNMRVFGVQTVAPEVANVTVNDGADQRSMVTSLTVQFTQAVDIASDAFKLENTTDNIEIDLSAASIVQVSPKIVRIEFGAGGMSPSIDARPTGNSLADGNYRLTVDSTKVTSQVDLTTAMLADEVFGDDAADGLFRLFGDINGDRGVGITDFADFRASFGATEADAAYIDEFNVDGDIGIGIQDFAAFRANFGQMT
ncbi:choice-of-anchor I family protein [Crateriforma conspicua]|uniref:Trifunctional nucleotide phosphoesterase protein YfkN n=1 Tax=Crateriforma conspicua TaxID=2527996 RepID=A0A5C5Y4W8_9PLAN|nr:choice-of-anchor I family protein [Crateriforma conspicua]TWT70697.1 Trifunctional nucleotide phosphoesterase protein YfkN precursor [Crateriforma conspicua]